VTDRRLRVLAGTAGVGAEIAARLDGASIRLSLGPDSTFERQVLIICLADLLGRLFPRLDVVVADDTCHPDLPPGPDSLSGRVAEARANGGLAPLKVGDDAIEVAIGAVASATSDLYVDAAGWQTYLGGSPSKLPDTNGDGDQLLAVGAVAAAARAAARITDAVLLAAPSEQRQVLGTTDSTYASCLSYRTDSEPIEEPAPALGAIDSVLIGAGSVGGASAYVFARTPQLAGSLVVVDPQILEPTNLDRALLATAALADQGAAKVKVVEQALVHLTALQVVAFQGDITAYHASLPREGVLPLVLTAVDSADARRAIQDCLPLRVLNAACHPHEVMVSGHSTSDGPCLCCLHMPELMNGDATKAKLIAAKTGFPLMAVVQLLTQQVLLTEHHLRGIEANNHMPIGALNSYLGHTLDELWRGQLLYGATQVETEGGAQVAVAAPYVTALAGTLLAGEALKAASAKPSAGLGPAGAAIKYTENPVAGPAFGQMSNPERWEGSECLCRSTRRLRILRLRYGLPEVTF
jgi:molybdopterin/thiamine biosynthesis adenylyltransferase